MKQNYIEELAEWGKQRKPPKERHRVAYLAVEHEVASAMTAGYTIKSIWRHMRATDRVQCSYEAFLNFVRRSQAHQSPAAMSQNSIHPNDSATLPQSVQAVARPIFKKAAQTSKTIPGFVFNPNYNKDDLL